MLSSSRRKAPSVKAGFKAPSYSNLESVSCSVLMARVSSFFPGGSSQGQGPQGTRR